MKACAVLGFTLLFSLVSVLRAEDKSTADSEALSVDQQLILACYQLDEVQVQKLLNSGADVNAKYLSKNFKELFRDRWTEGAVQIVVCSEDAGLAMCRQFVDSRRLGWSTGAAVVDFPGHAVVQRLMRSFVAVEFEISRQPVMTIGS